MGPLLPASFFQRESLVVAQDLVGMVLHRDGVAVRITEVEAYRWPEDSANHCRVGRTSRNEAMWGTPGTTYIYVCYGMHQMLNIVTDRVGHGAAVLVRAAEPVAGLETIRARRRGMSGTALLAGPGRLGAALALDTSWCGHALFEPGGLELRQGTRPQRLAVGPRVGVDYAEPEHRDAPWRLADARSRWVSHRRTLMGTEEG
jgi:DNA-3-methyladenine glycosylase